MDPDSCDFAALVLSVVSLLEFCDHSKELEPQDFCSGGRDSTDFRAGANGLAGQVLA